MDLNRLTQKAQEALKQAQTTAVRFGHQEVDVEHLLLALIEQEQGLVPGILERIGATPAAMKGRVEEALARLPRVSGPGVEPGNIRVTQRFSRVLVAAGDEAKRLKDEYISVEHLLLAMADEGRGAPASKILHDMGVDRKAILEQLKAIRGNQRATTDNPEGQYEALKK